MSDNSNGELRKVVCHASGDRCHACDHYYGRAESCKFKSPATSSDKDTIEQLTRERDELVDALETVWNVADRWEGDDSIEKLLAQHKGDNHD